MLLTLLPLLRPPVFHVNNIEVVITVECMYMCISDVQVPIVQSIQFQGLYHQQYHAFFQKLNILHFSNSTKFDPEYEY
jgi:hypothetical protein